MSDLSMKNQRIYNEERKIEIYHGRNHEYEEDQNMKEELNNEKEVITEDEVEEDSSDGNEGLKIK